LKSSHEKFSVPAPPVGGADVVLKLRPVGAAALLSELKFENCGEAKAASCAVPTSYSSLGSVAKFEL
jgi:hypothetical protein